MITLIAVQWATKTKFDMGAIRAVLDLREAGGIESFKSAGDIFSAALGYEQYLAERSH